MKSIFTLGLLFFLTWLTQAQTPYLGTPIPTPGKIEAEYLNFEGRDIAYNDVDDASEWKTILMAESKDVADSGNKGGDYHSAWISSEKQIVFNNWTAQSGLCIDENFTSATGTISDNSGSSNYENNTDCKKYITVTAGNTITLTFTSFDTEADYDSVSVYDGNTFTSPFLGKFSGTAIPPVLTTTGNKMLIHFISDHGETRAGWSANYVSNGTSVPVTGVTVSPTTTTVAVGSTAQLTATVAPANATNKSVSWASNNTSVATVNASGLVTGIAEGSATITVTTADGNKQASCSATVNAAQASDNISGFKATQNLWLNNYSLTNKGGNGIKIDDSGNIVFSQSESQDIWSLRAYPDNSFGLRKNGYADDGTFLFKNGKYIFGGEQINFGRFYINDGPYGGPGDAGTIENGLVIGGSGTNLSLAMGIDATNETNKYSWIQSRYQSINMPYDLHINPMGGKVFLGGTSGALPYFVLNINGKLGLGIDPGNSQDRLTVNGSVLISSLVGTGARMVVTDEHGRLGSMVLPGDGGSLLDNLGNHKATQNIILNSFQISNDGDSEGISINDQGNVGIGIIPNSSYVLNIGGDINFIGNLLKNGQPYGGSTGDNIQGYKATQNLWLNDFLLTNNGENGIRILNNGNVCIGVSQNFEHALNVGGDINFTGNLLKNGQPYGGSTGGSQWTQDGNNISSAVTGNVFIGDVSNKTGYKLNVAGKIRANEIVVNTSGADFVFEPTYKLRSLSELEAFIKANRHLPGIDPARKMQENGVSVSEMQVKLLQKVEELSLYIIELEKKYTELKAEGEIKREEQQQLINRLLIELNIQNK